MKSWFPWCRAPAGCLRRPGRLPAWWVLHLLLVPWTPQLAGALSVTHTGLPITVTLANAAVSFSCRVNYRDTSEHEDFTVTYFYVDLHGIPFYENSSEKLIACHPGPENQTLDCLVKPRLPNASATGTYYCSIYRRGVRVNGNGTFILVRDTGYQPPPVSSQKALLVGFTCLLSVLSVLGTALLLWKEKQMSVLGKQPTGTCPDPKSTSRPTKPSEESVYTPLPVRTAQTSKQQQITEGKARRHSTLSTHQVSRGPLTPLPTTGKRLHVSHTLLSQTSPPAPMPTWPACSPSAWARDTLCQLYCFHFHEKCMLSG